MIHKLFLGQSVTVMGLGLHGGGVAVVKWLVKNGARVTVTDLKNEKDLKKSLDALKTLKVRYVLGKHDIDDFIKADLVIKNPGVPNNSKYLLAAKNSLIPIENEPSLFFKYCQGQIIGVTGTRGKSTTTTLIYKILNQAKVKVWIAGLSGKPMMDIVDKVKEGDWVVLELSSWQLEILGEQKLSPDISVMTNVYPDHLNRYSGMSSYIKAKANIYKWQNQEDFSIFNIDNIDTKKLSQTTPSRKIISSKKMFLEANGCFIKGDKIYCRQDGKVIAMVTINKIKLPGEHNLSNVLAALSVVSLFGVTNQDVTAVLEKFSGLHSRIETIKEVRGVKYINDTTSTTPDATISALQALGGQKNIILIAGGDTKKIPQIKFKELVNLIKKNCKEVVLFSGPGSDAIIKELNKIKFTCLVTRVNNMTDAVSLSNSFSTKGDIILLSPACASFNLFSNEFDRGEQFNVIVKSLK